jgi:hypothetical protein
MDKIRYPPVGWPGTYWLEQSRDQEDIGYSTNVINNASSLHSQIEALEDQNILWKATLVQMKRLTHQIYTSTALRRAVTYRIKNKIK